MSTCCIVLSIILLMGAVFVLSNVLYYMKNGGFGPR